VIWSAGGSEPPAIWLPLIEQRKQNAGGNAARVDAMDSRSA
jgi:hypothetical protein